MCDKVARQSYAIKAPKIWGAVTFVFFGLIASFGWAESEQATQELSSIMLIQYADASKWNEYRDVRLKKKRPLSATESDSPIKDTSVLPQTSLDEVIIKKGKVEQDGVKQTNSIRKDDTSFSEHSSFHGHSTFPDHTALVDCPSEKTKGNNRGDWFLCRLDIANEPFLSPYGVDMPMSFMTPVSSNFSSSKPARIRVFLHPDDGGSGAFVTGPSSFAFRQDAIEIHNQEERYKNNPKSSWWGYSGGQVGKVENYNGRRIAISIDYLLKRYGHKVDLGKGIHLVGKSLGGAGVMHQSMILPKYQDKIASVDSVIGSMIMSKCCRSTVKNSWGMDRFDEVDIRLQWKKVQNTHFHWRGGSNDSLGRFDLEFFELCEQRKISCSGVWLRSGHGIKEKGYTLNMSIFTDNNQDVTLDKVLPVITNNSSNYHGKLRGYHNRGISWHHARIVDSAEKIQIPLRYIAQKNLGPELPDQPDTVSFSVTPRHIANFKIVSGDKITWNFGSQSGIAVVNSDGLFTIDNLMLKSGESYKTLDVKRHQPAVKSSKINRSLSFPIVYTRVPRTSGSHQIMVNGKSHTLTKADLWDTLPGVGRKFHRFNAPGQLVFRDQQGKETVIFDCVTDSQPCVPLDPMVSLDGTKIAFAVYRSAKFQNAQQDRVKLPNVQLGRNGQSSQIYIYNLKNRHLTKWPALPGVNDVSPAWLPDGRIMFTSTRNGFFRPQLNVIGAGKRREPRLFVANEDGSNVVDISPHEITAAMHPYVLNSGRVAYSSHWMSHNLAYSTNNGGINWPGTVDNMWVLMDSDYQGGDMTALVGAHKHKIKTSRGRLKTIKAFHFLGQRENNDICAANYYRSNNLGLGDVWCWPPEPKGIEGKLPTFLPRGVYNIADWSKSNDEPSFTESRLKIGKGGLTYLGKIGYPEGTQDNQLLLTVGRGYCTQIALNVEKTPAKLGNQPGCDVGLYKTTKIPSSHPDDLALIVDKPEWHEFGARIVRSRKVELPLLSRSGDQSCLLVSSDAGSAETALHRPYKFNHNYFNAANHGGEIDGVPHSELAAIRFWAVEPNRSHRLNFRNSIGNSLALLGDVPLLADKSFSAKLPCNVPYIMAGLDKQGRVIKRDQVPQSLRPGEKRVCSGCHLHSKQGRPYEQSQAFAAKPVSLTKTVPVPSYEKDIKPIFKARCSSCHTNDVPVMDYEKLVWDYFQTHVPDDKKVKVSVTGNSKRMHGLHRPYTSKYVNNMFARESLLYWKAANQRTDGRTDDTYNNDIDFGTDHPTDITPTELKAIGDWLDSGATQ